MSSPGNPGVVQLEHSKGDLSGAGHFADGRDFRQNERLVNASFGAMDAGLYDRCRPTYPWEAMRDMLTHSGRPSFSGLDVLEIGCGTGQLTESLVDAGACVTALEPSQSFAAYTRRRFATDGQVGGSVDVINQRFEAHTPAPGVGYDLIASATAFHWCDRNTRLPRAASMLNEGGVLAILHNFQIEGGDMDVFRAAHEIYCDIAQAEGKLVGNPAFKRDVQAELIARKPEYENRRFFDEPSITWYATDKHYSSSEYADLLSTYSAWAALSESGREMGLAQVRDYIDSHHGGRVHEVQLTVCRFLRRNAQPVFGERAAAPLVA